MLAPHNHLLARLMAAGTFCGGCAWAVWGGLGGGVVRVRVSDALKTSTGVLNDGESGKKLILREGVSCLLAC